LLDADILFQKRNTGPSFCTLIILLFSIFTTVGNFYTENLEIDTLKITITFVSQFEVFLKKGGYYFQLTSLLAVGLNYVESLLPLRGMFSGLVYRRWPSDMEVSCKYIE
jgi:hypothetical protein